MRVVLNSLHDEVAAQLRERIFSGVMAPGSFVDELALCSELSISRTPLREALKVLTAEGLLHHQPRRGCFVSEITERDLDEIFPVIALLEGRCAYEAANNASNADLAALEQLHERLNRHAQARRINDYYEANFAIHEAIITLANNRWLAQVIGDLRKLVKLARLQQLQPTLRRLGHARREPLRRRTQQQHQQQPGQGAPQGPAPGCGRLMRWQRNRHGEGTDAVTANVRANVTAGVASSGRAEVEHQRAIPGTGGAAAQPRLGRLQALVQPHLCQPLGQAVGGHTLEGDGGAVPGQAQLQAWCQGFGRGLQLAPHLLWRNARLGLECPGLRLHGLHGLQLRIQQRVLLLGAAQGVQRRRHAQPPKGGQQQHDGGSQHGPLFTRTDLPPARLQRRPGAHRSLPGRITRPAASVSAT